MSYCLCVQSDELSLQKKLRTEVIQLEDTLAQVRKEYEMLRIEFEQNLAANEQAGILIVQNAYSHEIRKRTYIHVVVILLVVVCQIGHMYHLNLLAF